MKKLFYTATYLLLFLSLVLKAIIHFGLHYNYSVATLAFDLALYNYFASIIIYAYLGLLCLKCAMKFKVFNKMAIKIRNYSTKIKEVIMDELVVTAFKRSIESLFHICITVGALFASYNYVYIKFAQPLVFYISGLIPILALVKMIGIFISSFTKMIKSMYMKIICKNKKVSKKTKDEQKYYSNNQLTTPVKTPAIVEENNDNIEYLQATAQQGQVSSSAVADEGEDFFGGEYVTSRFDAPPPKSEEKCNKEIKKQVITKASLTKNSTLAKKADFSRESENSCGEIPKPPAINTKNDSLCECFELNNITNHSNGSYKGNAMPSRYNIVPVSTSGVFSSNGEVLTSPSGAFSSHSIVPISPSGAFSSNGEVLTSPSGLFSSHSIVPISPSGLFSSNGKALTSTIRAFSSPKGFPTTPGTDSIGPSSIIMDRGDEGPDAGIKEINKKDVANNNLAINFFKDIGNIVSSTLESATKGWMQNDKSKDISSQHDEENPEPEEDNDTVAIYLEKNNSKKDNVFRVGYQTQNVHSPGCVTEIDYVDRNEQQGFFL